MRRPIGWMALSACLSLGFWNAVAGAADAPKPVRALLVAGGCCHDYAKQKTLMTQGVSALADVEWTIVHQGGTATDSKIALYEDADWAKGFDVVVHDECFAGVTDPAWVQRVLKPHKAGLPAVVLHCAMHSYRDKTNEWFKFLGVTSHGHGANYPFLVENLAKDDPIMAGFGASWMTPKGELYLISKLWDTATPLAQAMSRDSKKEEVCIWTNAYGPEKARVFGTTLGHHNEEVTDPKYLNLLARGVLWAAGTLDADHLHPAKAAIVSPSAKVLEDLARGKTVTASSFQSDDKAPAMAVDGDPETRWCADGATPDQWLRVNLGKPETLTGCRIQWEFDGGYRYKVEGSADGKSWTMLSDQSKTDDKEAERLHKFAAEGIRHVRLTITALDEGQWASLFAFEVFGTKLVDATAPTARAATMPDSKVIAGIKAPPGFTVTAFAAPPDISYPTCLAASPTGEVYVGVDENGSLDAKGNRGRVVRCVDRDGDGKADDFTTFAAMDSPRGIVVDGKTVYVLHPPTLTAFHDDDGDGKADRSDVLVKGIGFDLKFRGADHTTNGIRQGIDGWIYVAVGDYGFIKAEGTDGRTLPFLGGGIVRVRPDGSGLEAVSRGQRNIYDVAIDPMMNLFTRDNTNDGGGWDVRLSHVIPTGNYGYPSLFTRFNDEIVQPLADYGGGSPCGSLFLQEPGFPSGFGDTLYTCEWGRGGIFRHPLSPKGAGFQAGQELFVTMPRPTDMDVDGRSNIYVSSWRDGGFTFSKPDIGYVIRITADGNDRPRFPDLAKSSPMQLVEQVGSPLSAVLRQAAQRELLRRGIDTTTAKALETMAASDPSLPAKVAALFTLKQGLGAKAQDALVRLAKGDTREFALKALADRIEDAEGVPLAPFLSGLEDKNPRVRLQAVIGLGRLGKLEPAAMLVGLTTDPDPLVDHAAIKALVALRAIDACVAALLGPDAGRVAYGASHALQAIHDPRSVAGLARVVETTPDPAVKLLAFQALCRLHATESPYEGKWWSTRPDTSGPYYNPTSWEGTDAADQALRSALKTADDATAKRFLAELLRHKIDFDDTTAMALRLASTDPALRTAIIDLMASRPSLDAPAVTFLGSIALKDGDPGLRARAIRALIRHNREAASHDAATEALAAIGEGGEDPNPELLAVWREFVQNGRNVRDLAPIVRRTEGKYNGQGVLAFGQLLSVVENPKASPANAAEARKAIDRAWADESSVFSLLRAVRLARAKSQFEKIRALLADRSTPSGNHRALQYAAMALDIPIGGAPVAAVDPAKTLAKLPFDAVVASVTADKGDVDLGGRLFQSQSCVNCHSVRKADPVKGPYLGDITTRYNRAELSESILKPSAKIAQGFETQKVATAAGQVIEGFVSRESGDELELRNGQGAVIVIRKEDIEERGKAEQSIMPNGLLDPLTPHDLASILAYLDSLKGQ